MVLNDEVYPFVDLTITELGDAVEQESELLDFKVFKGYPAMSAKAMIDALENRVSDECFKFWVGDFVFKFKPIIGSLFQRFRVWCQRKAPRGGCLNGFILKYHFCKVSR